MIPLKCFEIWEQFLRTTRRMKDGVRERPCEPGGTKGDGQEPGGMGHHKADGDRNNNEDEEDEEEEEEEEEESDEGDTTDGDPFVLPQQPLVVDLNPPTEPTEMMKRKPIQSRKMQEYCAMQQLNSHSGKIWHCKHQSCNRVFHSAPGFRYHMQRHNRNDNDSFSCDVCRKVFQSSNGLKYHRKRKRCGRMAQMAASTSAGIPSCSGGSSSSTTTSSDQAPMLMELATIATGPQSPLLQGGGTSRSFFNEVETSAALTLSNMAQRSRSSKGARQKRNASSTHDISTPHNLSTPSHDLSIPHDLPNPPPHNCSTSRDLTTSHPARADDPTHWPTPGLEAGGLVIDEQDRHKSKRPMNGFMLFAQRYRADFNRQYPEVNNRVISTKLSEAWKKLPEDERQRWKKEAAKRAEHQKQIHPDCWKRKK